MGRFSYGEILLVLLVLALLFGGKKLPELGRGLGRGLANFKSALKDDDDKQPADQDKTDKTDAAG